jgi:hypothetical protein
MKATHRFNENYVRAIPDGQLALLKEALKREPGADENRQRERSLIRQLCLLPDIRGLAPEQFVLAVKLGLNAAASDLGIPLGPERRQLISRLLSISIEEFFDAGVRRSGRIEDRPERFG